MKSLLKQILYHKPGLLADVMRLKSNWNRDKYVFMKLLHRGDVVLDVGGNIGDYCTTFASIVGSSGHVFTFEPVPPTIIRLQEVINGKQLDNVTLIPNAVSSESGPIEIHMPGNDHARPAIHMEVRESWEVEVRVQTFSCNAVTLDEFVESQAISSVDFVKIDVEGAEYLVLEGGKKLLKEYSPILFFEMWDSYMRDFGTSPAVFCKLLREAGYDRFIVVQEVLHHFTNIEDELPSLLGKGILNLVCGKSDMHSKRFAKF